MKRFLLLTAVASMAGILLAQEQKEVVTGAGYVNDVYYSLENGTVDTAVRANWDIAFTADYYSSNIIANNGAGVELYTYNLGDTADWATVDTTGMNWSPMYNSLETFEEGAFGSHALGHPDYGWGEFNMSDYYVRGDSLFIIKTVSGAYKKLYMIEKAAAENIWKFQFANLDGSDEQSVVLYANDYNSKRFVYYSIDNQEVLDRDPEIPEWDLLFTKYIDFVPTPYPVSGIFINEAHIIAQEVREPGLNQATFMEYEEDSMSSNLSIIGGDWKRFTGTGWALDDTTVYFLKKSETTETTNKAYYYKIYFTGFTGMSEGKYTFMQELLSVVSARSPLETSAVIEVYPNPAKDVVNLVFDYQGKTDIQILDITGRLFYYREYLAGGFTTLSLDISDLNPGLFFIKLGAGQVTEVLRLVKQ